jgi:hypothetical protein
MPGQCRITMKMTRHQTGSFFIVVFLKRHGIIEKHDHPESKPNLQQGPWRIGFEPSNAIISEQYRRMNLSR